MLGQDTTRATITRLDPPEAAVEVVDVLEATVEVLPGPVADVVVS